MSWLRAAVTSVVLVAAAVALIAYLPNLLLNGQIDHWVVWKPKYARTTGVRICVTVYTVALLGILVALRRLQAKKVI